MKKTLVILAMTIFSFANAQKGTVLVSGSVSYWSLKESGEGFTTSNNSFGFSPKVGYQFTDNWTLGAEAEVSFREDKYTNQEMKSNSYSAGAFVRYSKPLSDLFLIYTDLGAGYSGTKSTSDYALSDPMIITTKANGFYAAIEPSVAINLKKGFGLNFSIGGLEYYSRNVDNGNQESRLYFNFGQSFTAGLSKNF